MAHEKGAGKSIDEHRLTVDEEGKTVPWSGRHALNEFIHQQGRVYSQTQGEITEAIKICKTVLGQPQVRDYSPTNFINISYHLIRLLIIEFNKEDDKAKQAILKTQVEKYANDAAKVANNRFAKIESHAKDAPAAANTKLDINLICNTMFEIYTFLFTLHNECNEPGKALQDLQNAKILLETQEAAPRYKNNLQTIDDLIRETAAKAAASKERM